MKKVFAILISLGTFNAFAEAVKYNCSATIIENSSSKSCGSVNFEFDQNDNAFQEWKRLPGCPKHMVVIENSQSRMAMLAKFDVPVTRDGYPAEAPSEAYVSYQELNSNAADIIIQQSNFKTKNGIWLQCYLK